MVAPLSDPAVKLTVNEPTPDTMLEIVGAAGICATVTEVRVGAVKLKVAALLAASAMVPLFSKIFAPSAIPFVSISKSLV